ncbi:hypothetical protein L486_07421 [Kwoniella mangroviensis CBS 10435]|uniref:Uncharacterized protein n=1 Tax=Kwoniella mangroviensis CBS 10435 TaxID=1331196 RepID=A0A1B9II63_9TREE|nr:uncharacterized protein I203_04981 [Kwoniella mangroviensis CBS 8507]OCF55306.1 hypothetical protein L486_07421 [Kwoniella mangroviensis CBS 10435]OCF65959.1 hypothetical protein I203_04981 [Kwoniella mangroviensis CBS 8507]
MDCTPTPISTIFSTSTSLIPSTITSSSAVLVTPSGSKSTWVVTSCSTPPSASQPTDSTTSAVSPSSTDSLSISTSTTFSDSSTSSDDVISFGMTSMTTADGGTLTTTAVDSPTSPVGQLQEETTLAVLDGQTLSSDESQSLLLNSHQRGIKGRRVHVQMMEKRQDNCQTITSTSTIAATPTTSWSLIFSTTESTSLVEVPVETVMGGCDGTTTTASSTEPVSTTSDSLASSSTTPAVPVSTSGPTQTSGSTMTTSLEEPSTSIMPSSSIPVSQPPTFTPAYTSSPVQDLETLSSSSSTSLDPLLSAVFTGPSLTTESGQASTTDLLAPITSDAIPTAQPTEIDSANTEFPLSSDTPITPDEEAPTSTEAEAEIMSSTKAVIPGVAGIQASPSSSSRLVTNTLASQNSKPTLNHHSSTSSTGGEEAEGESSGSNKGTAAGAAIGGIFALIALIAAILFFVRFWKKRQRAERTASLRASWFYGEKILNHNDGSENEKRRSTTAPSTEPSARPSIQPISRFSAPSFASRSEGLGALLARPLKNLRRDSSPLMKPLKLVSGDPNEEARRNEDNNLWDKIAYPFKAIPLPSTEGISERLRNIPGFKPRQSFTVKSRNISSPQPIDSELASGTNNGIFESSKLLPILSKFRSIRQSFKRSSILSNNLKYVRQSQARGTPAWADKHPNEKPIPVVVGEAWDERHSESEHPHPVKVNFMQPPPPSATGSSSRHGSMNSDSPYPTIVPGNSHQNHGIGTAFSSGMDMDMEYNKTTHVQLRHLTWGSSYAPPRTSVLSANGMMIHGAMEPSEDGNSIYSRTSMSHGHGSNNLHRSGTMKSNFSDSNTSNFMIPPRSSISHNSGNRGNVPSPPPIGMGPFPRALFSPLSAGSNGSRGSFGVLPPLPENGIDTDKHMKDLRRITRSTQHSSGIWEYSAYVDTGSNANSQRGSGSNSNGKPETSGHVQGERRTSNGQSSLTSTGPMGILKSTSSYSPLPPTMIYPSSNWNSPIPIYAPTSAPGPGDIPYTVPSPKRISYGGSMLKHSSLPPSSPHGIDHSSLPLPLPSHGQTHVQKSYTSPIPSILAPKSVEEGDRITKAWYEKPLWDNTQQSQQNQVANPTSILLPPRSAGPPPGSGPDYTYMYSQKSGNSVYSKGDRASRKSVKSVKSVRWEDEDGNIDEVGGRAL